jgi:hypothetical protein
MRRLVAMLFPFSILEVRFDLTSRQRETALVSPVLLFLDY